MKWLGIVVFAFAVANVGWVASATFPAALPAPLPGPLGIDDLSVWVVEPKEPEAVLPRPRVSFSAWPSVANRNSNPLNIKLGSETRRYVDVGLATVSEITPKDGGRFLKFDSAETGFRAGVALLNTPPYADLDLDRALRRWSNNGFGTAILAGAPLDAQKSIAHLNRNDLKTLLGAMAAAEGYKSPTIGDEIRNALRP